MKTVLVTGIGGLTPRSIAGIIKENHPDYKIIGCDIEKSCGLFYIFYKRLCRRILHLPKMYFF